MARKSNSGLLKRMSSRVIIPCLASVLTLGLVGCEDQGSEPERNLDSLAASGGHLYSGDDWHHSFEVTPNSTYTLHFTYSNDDNTWIDQIGVYVGDRRIDTFKPEDTGNWGAGWGNYVESETYEIRTSNQSSVNISIHADKTDSYGFRPDEVFLERVR
jgi:hypothetical protein